MNNNTPTTTTPKQRRPTTSTLVVSSPVTGNSVIDSMDLDELMARRDLMSNPLMSKAYNQRRRALAHEHARTRTDQIIAVRQKRQLARRAQKAAARGAIVSESEIGEMQQAGDNNDVNQNVQDHSGESVKKVSVGVTPSVNDNGMFDAYTLARFLERPVSIYDTTFAIGVDHNVAIRPWDLWSLNPSVRGKLSNFAYFRGTLHLKLAFSGTPFHYGRMMLSYQPFSDGNNILEGYDNMLAATAPGSDALPCYKTYLSQAPGIHYIDVKANEPVELTLPFFAPKEQLRLYNNTTTVITNADSYQDFEAMGELRIVSLNQIQIANEDFDSAVSLNVYAWCTDVQLTIPTGTDMDITAESLVHEAKSRNRKHAKRAAAKVETLAEDIEEDLESEGEDEEEASSRRWSSVKEQRPMYDSSKSFGERFSAQMEKAGEYTEPGPVSKVAGAVSDIGNALSDVPVIGKFARATAQVGGWIGKAANWFGLSKPPILEKAMFVKNNPYQNGSVFAAHETTYKLTCDPKQELSIDQTLGGAGSDDCMAIKHISSRETYLTTFTWSSSDVAMQDNLWSGNVTPAAAVRTTNFNGGKVVQPTSLYFAVMPFSFWRGTITYRFEFVTSKFHRGKALIKFDPNGSQQALIDTGDSKLNQQTSIIVDLQTTQNVEFSVEWNNSRAWCMVPYVSAVSDFMDTYGQTTDPLDNTMSLGFITVRPLNELVQPTDLSTVPVNVYIRCDDLEVAAPSTFSLDGQTRDFIISESLVAESGVASKSEEESTNDTLVKTGASHKNAHLMHFGERIESFRACLKRYVGAYAHEVTTGAAGPTLLTFRGNVYPQLANPVGSGLVSKAIETNLFSYLRLAYVGMRGGMRYRTRYFNQREDHYLNYYVTARRDEMSDYQNLNNSLSSSAVVSAADAKAAAASWTGTVVYHIASNGGVEFEIPYYSENVFQFSFDQQEGNGAFANNDIMVNYGNTWSVQYQIDNVTSDVVYGIVDSATAEDFTFLRYQGAPFYTTF